MTFIFRNRTLFLETGQYFGISQNGIEDKKVGRREYYLIKMSKYDNIYNYNDVGVNMEDKELMECGLGLCLVVSSTGHVEMWTRV